MKRRHRMTLRAPPLAVVLLVAGAQIGWFGDSISAASTVAAAFNTNLLVVTGTDENDSIVVSAIPLGRIS